MSVLTRHHQCVLNKRTFRPQQNEKKSLRKLKYENKKKMRLIFEKTLQKTEKAGKWDKHLFKVEN